MSWSIGRMARYVAQCKYFDQLKQNEDLCIQAFKTGKYLMFSDGKPLLNISDKAGTLSIKLTSFTDTSQLCGEDLITRSTLVGVDEERDDTALFACPTTATPVEAKFIPTGSKFSEMRLAVTRLDPKGAILVSRGYSMLKWLDTMRFCPTCASALSRNASGTTLICGSCPNGNRHYPITHPVAITRVEDPTGERVLLVRQPRHPSGMYSCIAGFIESGEPLEDAVRREVAEEAGIVIGKVEYFDSQTWPLPQNSLMLACTTRAMPGSLTLDIDHEELEEAKWFSKEEVTEAFHRVVSNPDLLRSNKENLLLIPPSGAIAHHLLKNWVGL